MFTDPRGVPAPDPQLRVALVTGNYHCVADDAARTANRLVAFLQRAGVPVRVFAPCSPTPALAHEGELVPVPSLGLPHSPRRVALGLPPSSRRELRRFAPTLLHIGSADLLGFAALRWARLRGLPAVATCSTPPGDSPGVLRGLARSAAWVALRWFYRRCAEVYVPASSVAAKLRGNGVSATIVETPPGVNAEQFHPGRRSPEWRHSLGIAESEVVVALAALARGRLTMFADVLRDLAANGLAFRMLVLGATSADVRLPDALFTGPLTPEALATAVASADLFLDPAEGGVECGSLEAMASGVPVVAADSVTNRDAVRNGVDGIVCRPDDRAGFALVVRRLVENPAARENLRRAAARRAADYHREALLGDMIENYNRVLRRWPIRARW